MAVSHLFKNMLPIDLLNNEPNLLSTSAGIRCISQAWRLFKKQPGLWIAAGVAIGLSINLLMFLPLIGQPAAPFLLFSFSGGVCVAAHRQVNGQAFTVNDLLVGFQSKSKAFLLLTLLYWLPVLLIMLLSQTIFDVNTASAHSFDWQVVLVLLLLSVLFISSWLASALIMLHDIPPARAMKLSLKGCADNIFPLLAFGIAFAILLILSLIPLGLGLFVTAPMFYISCYTLCRAIWNDDFE